ncbi:hypothetical protein ACDT10_24425 [Mycobacterium intracellulare]|uniref:hypothetical protein n=1 Tax=Mycobacterium intracellulare TaxID=1767 RepID=UPI0035568C23
MSWGDLWEYPFLASVWGTANGWVGTIVTGFSFLLAANTYRKNRQDKRREQASLIVFTNYFTSMMDQDFYLTTIRGTVHNHSSSLVTNAAIVVEMTKRTARHRLSRFDRWFRPHKKTIAYHKLQSDNDITCTILPGADTRYMVEIPYEKAITADEVVVQLSFMDANSVEWERPFMGAPLESKLPGRIRTAIITRLQWKDWEKENQNSDENPGEDE